VKSLQELADCARRELAMRKRVYPGFVNARRMAADKCRHEIECMEEILTVLVRLKADGGTAGQRQLGL
jgi:hypothetical protein